MDINSCLLQISPVAKNKGHCSPRKRNIEAPWNRNPEKRVASNAQSQGAEGTQFKTGQGSNITQQRCLEAMHHAALSRFSRFRGVKQGPRVEAQTHRHRKSKTRRQTGDAPRNIRISTTAGSISLVCTPTISECIRHVRRDSELTAEKARI